MVVTAARHLSTAGSVRLDISGNGQVELAPSSEDWLIGLTRISCTGTSPEPTVITYRSGVSPSGEIEGSYSGMGDSSNTQVLISAGETLIAVWTGGPAAALAVLRIEGVAYPPGGGITALAGG